MSKYDFDSYQSETKQYLASTGDEFKDDMAIVLGLIGESGEVAEKYKKIVRDKNSIVSEEDRQELGKELGDTLWYIASLADRLDYKLSDIAEINLDKLSSRKKNNTIQGEGDNR